MNRSLRVLALALLTAVIVPLALGCKKEEEKPAPGYYTGPREVSKTGGDKGTG